MRRDPVESARWLSILATPRVRRGWPKRCLLIRGLVEALTFIRERRKINGAYRIKDMRRLARTAGVKDFTPICLLGETARG
jgi:hypothetical protein